MSSSIDKRRLVNVHAERVTDVSSTDFPGHYPGEDHSWNLDLFKKKLKVEVTRLSQRSIDFDLVGVDASIANAFRRIMIAEVPTIAIEHVYVWNNTSVIHDEILAHRLGLVPLNVDPALMDFKSPDEGATDRNTLVFKISLTCQRNPSYKPSLKSSSASSSTAPSTSSPLASSSSNNPDELYINHELLSSHLEWSPVGEQVDVFANKPPAPTNPNIVLAKLRPGQQIEMELHAVKGVGKDHAKFNPVATASYRLLPHIGITSPIPPHLAYDFQKCFAPGVINVDPRTKAVSVDPVGVRNDTVSREVLRHPEFEGMVKLARVRDHFMFNVESESAYAPERILPEAIAVMRSKIAVLKAAAEALRDKGPSSGRDVVMADA